MSDGGEKLSGKQLFDILMNQDGKQSLEQTALFEALTKTLNQEPLLFSALYKEVNSLVGDHAILDKDTVKKLEKLWIAMKKGGDDAMNMEGRKQDAFDQFMKNFSDNESFRTKAQILDALAPPLEVTKDLLSSNFYNNQSNPDSLLNQYNLALKQLELKRDRDLERTQEKVPPQAPPKTSSPSLWPRFKAMFSRKPQADVAPKVAAAAAAKPEEPAQVKFESTFDLDTLSKVTTAKVGEGFRAKIEPPETPIVDENGNMPFSQQVKDVDRSGEKDPDTEKVTAMVMKDIEGNVLFSVEGHRTDKEKEEKLPKEIDEFFKNIGDKCGKKLGDQLYLYAHQGGYFNSAENALAGFFLSQALFLNNDLKREPITFTLLKNGDVQFTESFTIKNIAGPSVKEGAQSVSGQLTCTSILSLDSEGKLQQTQGKVTLTSDTTALTALFEGLNKEIVVEDKKTRLFEMLTEGPLGAAESLFTELKPPPRTLTPQAEGGVLKLVQPAAATPEAEPTLSNKETTKPRSGP